MLCCRFCVLFVVLLVVVTGGKPAAVAAAAPRRTAAETSVPIRGKEDLELNCPSIAFRFPRDSSLRCESCRATGAALAYLVGQDGVDAEEATEVVCARLLSDARLRQARCGLRFWDLQGLRGPGNERTYPALASNELFADELFEPPLVVAGDKSDEQRDPLAVTYHTAEERVALPCAHYFLQRDCDERLGANDEAYDACFAAFRRSVRDGHGLATARVELRDCLVEQVCGPSGTKECGTRAVVASEEAERERFMKYQATFSNPKFPYVADRQNSRRFERNPFARGGKRERENDFDKDFSGEL